MERSPSYWERKTSGVRNESPEDTKLMILKARQDYLQSIEHLKSKKGELHQLKANNNEERKALRREEREKERTKFKPIKKKTTFLPYIKTKQFLNDHTPINIGSQFFDLIDRQKMIMPDKCCTNKPPVNQAGDIWKTQDPKLNLFRREVKAELDSVDYDYEKYMKCSERGVDLPSSVSMGRYRNRRATE